MHFPDISSECCNKGPLRFNLLPAIYRNQGFLCNPNGRGLIGYTVIALCINYKRH